MDGDCKKTVWAGRAISGMLALPFLMSAIMKFSKSSQVLEGFAHLGWPESLVLPIGILEFVCLALYLIPQVSILGAILLTGYLGGAIATHVRIGEPVIVQSFIGILIWFGLFLRDSRLRKLIPIRVKIGLERK